LSHAHVDEVAAGDPCHARVGLEHLLRVEILGDGVLPEVRVGHVGVRVVVGVRHGLVTWLVLAVSVWLFVLFGVLVLVLRLVLLLVVIVSIRECILLRLNMVGLLFVGICIVILLIVVVPLFGLWLDLVWSSLVVHVYIHILSFPVLHLTADILILTHMRLIPIITTFMFSLTKHVIIYLLLIIIFTLFIPFIIINFFCISTIPNTIPIIPINPMSQFVPLPRTTVPLP